MNDHYSKGELKPLHLEETQEYNQSTLEDHKKKLDSMKFKKIFGKDFPAKINLDFETIENMPHV